MPWKNGGGSTSEIATFPEGAGLDDFHWRLSMARVDADGPFSVFPGVDRTLALVEGNGLVLSVGVRAPVGLRSVYDPLPFPGDDATRCSLIDGPVTDLNVMTRRGYATHVMQAIELSNDETAQLALGNRLVFCANGRLSIDDGGIDIELDRFDTLAIARDDGMLRITALEPSVILVTELYRAD
jgi:environmental stress-induced protein Ves